MLEKGYGKTKQELGQEQENTNIRWLCLLCMGGGGEDPGVFSFCYLDKGKYKRANVCFYMRWRGTYISMVGLMIQLKLRRFYWNSEKKKGSTGSRIHSKVHSRSLIRNWSICLISSGAEACVGIGAKAWEGIAAKAWTGTGAGALSGSGVEAWADVGAGSWAGNGALLEQALGQEPDQELEQKLEQMLDQELSR